MLTGPTTDVVFDLAQLTFISSAGLRVFALTRKTLKERGGQASFVHMQPQIQEVFEIMRSLPGVAVFRTWRSWIAIWRPVSALTRRAIDGRPARTVN